MKFNTPITIVGAGAVGGSIALALYSDGAEVSGIYSLNGISAKRIANKIRTKNFGKLNVANIEKGIIIIAVPDSQISVVSALLAEKRTSFKGFTVFHTSGALDSSELSLLKKKGACTASFHPVQTFPVSKISPCSNIWFGIEGDAKAVQTAAQVAKILHSYTFTISKEAKVLYHTAAVFASNYIVTLLSVVEQICRDIKIPQETVWKIFQPLVEQTIKNVFSSSSQQALTGPIARGDVKIVSKHLKAISKKQLNHLVPLYSVSE